MGLPQPVAAACRQIGDDRLLRSHEVARRALAAMGELFDSLESSDVGEMLDLSRICASSLARSRPAMGSLTNVMGELHRRIVRLSERSDDPRDAAKEVVSTFVSELERSLADVARQVGRVVGPEMTILASSCSRPVIDGLHRGRARKVIVAESRPGFDGRQAATRLAEDGLNVELVSDAASPSFVRSADLVLVGALSVLADGACAAKVGTYGIGLAAREKKRRLLVVAETMKISPIHATPQETRPGEELWESPPPGVSVSNPSFDLLPAKLISGIVTERGLIDEEQAAKTASRRRPGWRALGLV